MLAHQDRWAGTQVEKELVVARRAGTVLVDCGERNLPRAHRELPGHVHRLRFPSGWRYVGSASGLKEAPA